MPMVPLFSLSCGLDSPTMTKQFQDGQIINKYNCNVSPRCDCYSRETIPTHSCIMRYNLSPLFPIKLDMYVGVSRALSSYPHKKQGSGKSQIQTLSDRFRDLITIQRSSRCLQYLESIDAPAGLNQPVVVGGTGMKIPG